MNSQTFQWLHLLLILNSPLFLSSNPLWFQTCNISYNCGTITGIHYPFIGNRDPQYCGYPGFELTCNSNNTTTIQIKNMQYRVLEINQNTQIMRIAREDVMESVCPQDLVNTTLDYDLFRYSSNYMNLTFRYGCPSSIAIIPGFVSCGSAGVYVLPGSVGPGSCNASVVVPVVQSGSFGSVNTADLDRILRAGLEVGWIVGRESCRDCTESGGRCGYDYSRNQTTCFCSGPPYLADTCPAGNGAPRLSGDRSSANTNSLNVVLPVVGAILAGIGFGWLFFFCRQRRKRRMAAQTALTAQPDSKELTMSLSSKDISSSTPSVEFTRSIPSYPSSQSELGIASMYFGAQVFSYAELEEATDNFDRSRELGDGGFGTVYYAKLADGREVAVKRLFENNFKRVEQFMNEVNILTRLHHQYLVKLYGCTSKRSRELLLVYEYIPNGTVGDHLNGKLSNSGKLHWPVRLNIAIQTAEALSYLHTSEIIHRDVKTNNILLDDKFSVKVADFGLSRLFPMDQTHVSTAPQGTPGYVDPEYYQCYQLTEKSDVYSFGVVLVELISSLQAVDTNRHRHDINLSNMAVSKIQNQDLDGLVDPGLGFKTDRSVRRMVTLVAELAFRCLQSEKDMRPSMKEVLDTLRGIRDEKAEVVEIIVDDSLPLKSNNAHSSPDLYVTEKWVSSSAPNSSG